MSFHLLHTRRIPEGGLHLIYEAVDLEVDVLVQGQELDALEDVKDIPFVDVDRLNVLKTKDITSPYNL